MLSAAVGEQNQFVEGMTMGRAIFNVVVIGDGEQLVSNRAELGFVEFHSIHLLSFFTIISIALLRFKVQTV